MKKISYILFLALTTLFVSSCEKDMGPQVPADATAPSITSPSEAKTLVLTKLTENDQALSLEWSAADFKMDNIVLTYSIEVRKKGSDLERGIIIVPSATSPYNFTVSSLNKALLGAGYASDETHEVELLVVASNYKVSAPVALTVTTYFDAEPWSIIGSAVGGWNPENDQFMAYDAASESYSITLDMKPGEFKFRAPKRTADDVWKSNLGIDGGVVTHDNATDMSLTNGSSNIGVSGGNYTITLKVTGAAGEETGTFTIVQNSAGAYTDWTEAILDAVGDGISIDNATATADGSGWSWGNVILPGNEGKPTKDGSTYTWLWEGITLEADNGFKVRTKNGEEASNGISFDLGFGAIDATASSAKVVDKDGNISVTEKGTYSITVTIDAANGDAKKVVITEYVKYPSQIYLVGSLTGWNENEPHYIAPQDADAGKHVAFLTADATTKFKLLAAVGTWDDAYGIGDAAGKVAVGGDNVVAKDIPGYVDEGQYIMKIDLDAGTVELIKIAKVTVVGDGANANWPSDAGEHLGQELAYDAASKSFTANVNFNAAGEWKFRFNDSWDISLGSNEKDMTKLTLGGGNFDTPGAEAKKVSLFLESKEQFKATLAAVSK